MQVADLIHYNHTVRAAYLEAIAKLPWNQVTANRGLSWVSIRNVFLHLTLVEDRWINYAIPEQIHMWVDPDFNAFTDAQALHRYMTQVHDATERFLKTEKDFKRKIEVPWGEKPYSHLPLETVLTHMVLEDMIHFGELTAAIWQLGVEPPYKAYWRFKQNHP